MIVDFTHKPPPPEPEPVLLQPKRRWSLNPFSYLWTAMQHMAYFVAPANECVYCWLWRMFFIGAVMGSWITYWALRR